MSTTKMSREDRDMLMQAAQLGLLSNYFRGKEVAITGTLSMRREDVVQLILAAGGRFAPRVRWGTRILIAGDTGRHGVTRKIQEARQMGVAVIDEREFVERLSVKS